MYTHTHTNTHTCTHTHTHTCATVHHHGPRVEGMVGADPSEQGEHGRGKDRHPVVRPGGEVELPHLLGVLP